MLKQKIQVPGTLLRKLSLVHVDGLKTHCFKVLMSWGFFLFCFVLVQLWDHLNNNGAPK